MDWVTLMLLFTTHKCQESREFTKIFRSNSMKPTKAAVNLG